MNIAIIFHFVMIGISALAWWRGLNSILDGDRVLGAITIVCGWALFIGSGLRAIGF